MKYFCVGFLGVLVLANYLRAQCAPPASNDNCAFSRIHGEIEVAVNDPAMISVQICYDVSEDHWDVRIERTSSPVGVANVTIIGQFTTTKIGDVCITNTECCQHAVLLSIRGPTTGSRVASVRSIVSTGTGSAVTLQGLLASGNLGEGVSSVDYAVDVEDIASISILGNILGDVRARTLNIDAIACDSLLADVRCPMGFIDTIDAATNIGSASSNVQLRAMDGITSIEADKIYADIDTRIAGGSGNLGSLLIRSGSSNLFRGSLITKSVTDSANDGIHIYGDLDANITIETNVIDPIVIDGEVLSGKTIEVVGQMLNNGTSQLGSLSLGELSGTVKFTRNSQAIQGPVTINTVSSTGRFETKNTLESGRTITVDGYMDGLIKIGDSLAGTIDINQSQGLRGQIIINADNMTTPGTWASSGSVLIGSLNFNPNQTNPLYDAPYYDALPSALGGGSIGLAPFRLHAAACTPPHGTIGDLVDLVYTDFDVEDSTPVIIRSYGPLANTSVLIDLMVPNSDCTGSEVTSMFTRVLAPNGNPCELGIGCTAASLMKQGVMRVRPNGLACAEVVGTPEVVWQTDDGCTSPETSYICEVAPDCDGEDGNDNAQIAQGDVDPHDEFPDVDVNDNGVLDTCESIICDADWDGSYEVDVPDIFAFLSDWFANLPAARCYGGTCDTPAIFAFLADWFASRGANCGP